MFYAILFWLSFLFFIIFSGYDHFNPSTTRRWTRVNMIFLLIMLALIGYKLFGQALSN